MECPKCGGETWDNRQKKADGAMSAKAPDFACKDRENCGGVIWPPREKGSGWKGKGGGNGATPPQGRPPTRIVSQAEVELFWKSKRNDYRIAFAITSKIIGASALAGDAVGAASSAATGLCIALDRYRQQPPADPIQPAVKAVQPPPPKREPAKVMPKGLEDEEDIFSDEDPPNYDGPAPWDR